MGFNRRGDDVGESTGMAIAASVISSVSDVQALVPLWDMRRKGDKFRGRILGPLNGVL